MNPVSSSAGFTSTSSIGSFSISSNVNPNNVVLSPSSNASPIYNIENNTKSSQNVNNSSTNLNGSLNSSNNGKSKINQNEIHSIDRTILNSDDIVTFFSMILCYICFFLNIYIKF
jgi:hypothetical protein